MSDQLLDTPAKHAFSLSSLVDRTWNNVLESAIRTGWGPVTRIAEAAVVALLQKITRGELRVVTANNTYTFPDHPKAESGHNRDGPKAELRVVNDVFWVRLALMSDLGFAEAYMYGDVECNDLVFLFLTFLENKENLASINSSLAYLVSLPQKITSYRFLNTLGNSRSNISAHYDISNDMFAGFLSDDMTYSCAIFEDLDGDLKHINPQSQLQNGHSSSPRTKPNGNAAHPTKPRAVNGKITNGHVKPPSGSDSDLSDCSYLHEESSQDDLYEAQMRKLKHVMKKAHIQPGHRILEIGSGWGSMAILIAQTYPDTHIDTLTLSVQQQTLARERIKEAGLEDRIEVHLMDYRDMPAEWEDSFDRVISIEMIEAVGAEFLQKYWEMVDWAMKKKGGVGVVQVITIPEARYDRYIKEIDFIRKWSAVFPGGFLPTVTLLLETMKAGSSGGLIVDSVSNIGPHYARTLREWRGRFLDKFDSVIVPALKREYPQVMCGPQGTNEIEVFKRKWLYYYCYCEVGFTTRTLGDHIITFVREGYQDFGCDVYE